MRTINKKMSWVLGAAALITVAGPITLPHKDLWPSADNGVTRAIRAKLAAFMDILPEDRVYLQVDRPFYQPGDDIWISAWVRDGESLKPSSKSDIVTVDLISPRGSVEKSVNLIARSGLASGDFSLDKEMPGGLYRLRAYTEWMKNDGEDRCFEKEIQVQDVVLPALKLKLDFVKKAYGAGDEVQALVDVITSENKPLANSVIRCHVSLDGKTSEQMEARTDHKGNATVNFTLPHTLRTSDGLLNILVDYNGSTESISRAVPIVRNDIRMAFYPEGGEMVYGLPSRVAFRAANEFGKAADVEGELLDDAGRVITKFSSYHMGMGSLRFTPQVNRTYYARITRPAGIAARYDLPEPLVRGFAMQAQILDPGTARVNIATSETGEMSLVAQMRGKVLYTSPLPLVGGTNSIDISTEGFPMGVLQLTLFDHKGISRAERLLFVNRERQLSVTIRPDKQKYLPREKIKLSLLVRDERGIPSPALLSMAVVNDQLLAFADDRSGNILSQLLLQDDIKEKVEEPSFYFDSKQAKAKEALDLLMMTAGWRRFTWEQVIDKEIVLPVYAGRRAVIAGTVMDAATGKPVEGAVITAGKTKCVSDKEGRCNITGQELYEPISLKIEKQGYHSQVQQVAEYADGYTWYIYDQRQPNYSRWHNVPMMEMAVAEEASPATGAADVRRVGKKSAVAAPRIAGQKNAVPPVARPAVAKDGDARRKFRQPAGNRADRFGRQAAGDMLQAGASAYHRAREFAAPLYKPAEVVASRNDFRNTIYWNPRIEVGHNGRATVEFFASDEVTSFRAIAEGISGEGQAGRGEEVFFTQLPFQLLTKIPTHLTGGDLVSIPVTLKNNTAKPLGGTLRALMPSNLVTVTVPDSVQTVMPGDAKTVYYTCRVKQSRADTAISIGFRACAMQDELTAEVKIRPQGFPASVSFGGQCSDKEYTFETMQVVEGSLGISFNAYPDVISDLMKGVEGILREPYGCFEQTSCTAYPNAMVMNYLKASGTDDQRLLASAGDLLDRGYKRLTTFETKTKGYEWFGASPAHEGLTAYGIMEFMDMKRAGQEVDDEMIARTAKWLLNHRDGKGGFAREQRALHDFGRISDDVMNAYIVYALADAGYKEIGTEFDHTRRVAERSGDPYLIALAANAAFRLGKFSEAKDLLSQLQKKQEKDGSFTGSSHSITFSQGRSLGIETTALAVLAMLESGTPDVQSLERSVRWILSMRDGSGSFSSTQGTILALKALTSYAVFNKRAKEDGEIQVYIDGKRVATQLYKAGERGEIKIGGLERYVSKEGRHTIRVKYTGVKNPLPYSVAVDWNTNLPRSHDECALDVKSRLLVKTVKVGETARLSVVMSNKRQNDLPSAIAVVGIPAGLSVQAWQLKELQEKHVFDYYEITGDRLALYYRGIGPAAVHEINLDLKAEVPGEFTCPATSAYLYYTNEFKSWSGAGMVKVVSK